MPCYPMCSPKPIIDNWSINIYWLNHIVFAIDIFIAYDLYSHLLRSGIFLYINRSHILIDIFCKNGLKEYQMHTFIFKFNYTEIIYLAVPIEVKVRDTFFGVIEFLFKVFEIISFAEDGCYCLKV